MTNGGSKGHGTKDEKKGTEEKKLEEKSSAKS